MKPWLITGAVLGAAGLVILLGAGSPSPAGGAAPEYAVRDLGRFPGRAYGTARDVNINGVVVGYADDPGAENSLALRWRDGAVSELPSPPGCRDARATGINDAGLVVGTADRWMGSDRVTVACLWRSGGVRVLASLGGHRCRAERINSHGRIAGWGELAGSNPNKVGGVRALLWTGGKLIRLLAPLDADSEALDINDSDSVVGVITRMPGDTGISQAVLWRKNRRSALGTLGGQSSYAIGINNDAEIVGAADTPEAKTHAFLWKDGRMSDLGTLGAPESAAVDINNRHQIVGQSQIARSPALLGASGPLYHAFRSDGGKMVDLNDVIPAGIGWILLEAHAINDPTTSPPPYLTALRHEDGRRRRRAVGIEPMQGHLLARRFKSAQMTDENGSEAF
jgi:probable HAF family extracellular repeat protein